MATLHVLVGPYKNHLSSLALFGPFDPVSLFAVGLEPTTPTYTAGVLPLHYASTHQLGSVTPCDMFPLWWTAGESNPDLRLARPV